MYKILNCDDLKLFNIYKKIIINNYSDFTNIKHHKNLLDFILGSCVVLNSMELFCLRKIDSLKLDEEFGFYDFVKIYLDKINKI